MATVRIERKRAFLPVFQQLRDMARPYIQAYHRDLLVHDRRMLRETEGTVPFLHWTRSTGTHMVILWPHDSDYYPEPGAHRRFLFGHRDRHGWLEYSTEMARSINRESNQQKLVLYYDGKRFAKIDCKTAIGIAEEHNAKIRVAWAAARS